MFANSVNKLSNQEVKRTGSAVSTVPDGSTFGVCQLTMYKVNGDAQCINFQTLHSILIINLILNLDSHN